MVSGRPRDALSGPLNGALPFHQPDPGGEWWYRYHGIYIYIPHGNLVKLRLRISNMLKHI